MTGITPIAEFADVTGWDGPYAPDARARAQDALEKGAVLFFPHLAFRLANSEMDFLDARLSDGKAKNISLDPSTGQIQGTSAVGEKAERLTAMIERFGAGATRLVTGLLPNYGQAERARTSYRPVEVEGRAYSPIQDDRLLHVDAFPSRPMKNGTRILRFFANVAPSGGSTRRWHVGENFEDFARGFMPRLKSSLPGKNWLLETLGVTKGRRSAYDDMMLALHDGAKMDGAYQAGAPQAEVLFPPGSCWMVYTDQVLHAALAGEFALEQTFHFPVENMAAPDRAPIRVLEKLTGKSLS